MKSYTDLEQSRNLINILPVESADMIWVLANPDLPVIKAITYENSDKNNKYYEILPAWSLAILLSVIPKYIKTDNVLRIDIDEENFSIWYDKIGYGVNTELPDIIMECPIDACVSMIEKLHELNLL